MLSVVRTEYEAIEVPDVDPEAFQGMLRFLYKTRNQHLPCRTSSRSSKWPTRTTSWSWKSHALTLWRVCWIATRITSRIVTLRIRYGNCF
ncbi:hypothetical protein RvY_14408-2 [Ramazzottius varieornatus]|uniref:BTB domain-containing protein n=1 Tax=Ramazzottius varieornatus TaxID=947166 RepID=A0A1D1VR78_RAMVA|nr:hypothetical protein RvY_14408-2 [Ramazzottius varieornatus]